MTSDGVPLIQWINSDMGGCGVYRCYIPGMSLQAMGFENKFILHREFHHAQYEVLPEADIVVMQRAPGPKFTELMRRLKQTPVKVVVELDDDVYHLPSSNPAAPFWSLKPVRKAITRQLEMADAVIVSTEPLRQSLLHKLGVRDDPRVHVCANHLHPDVWGPEVLGSITPYANGFTTVIGWQGSTTHNADFLTVLPALTHILDAYPQVRLRFFGYVPMCARGVIPEPRFQWSKGVPFQRYPTMLRYHNFDIGIAPLVDNKFNAAKSNLKVLEYAACGVPCVASNVTPYRATIEYGVTGFLANTTEEWVTYLAQLIESPERRRTMAAAVSQYAWTQWNADTRAPSWARVMNALLGREDTWSGQSQTASASQTVPAPLTCVS